MISHLPHLFDLSVHRLYQVIDLVVPPFGLDMELQEVVVPHTLKVKARDRDKGKVITVVEPGYQAC